MKSQIQFSLNGPLKNLIPKRFVFLRHGRTEWNLRSLVMGKKDIAIDSTGESQADEASKILKQQQITSIWTSPLIRCQRTAWHTAQQTGLDPRVVNGLSERDWGEYEGEKRDTRDLPPFGSPIFKLDFDSMSRPAVAAGA